MSLNVKKTDFIIFHNRQKKIDIVPKIIIDKNQNDQVRSTKFLGVLINEYLTWSDHISAVLTPLTAAIRGSGYKLFVKWRRYPGPG